MGFAQGEEKMTAIKEAMDKVVEEWNGRHNSLPLQTSNQNKDDKLEIQIIPFSRNHKAEADPHYEIKRYAECFRIGFHIQRADWFDNQNGDRYELWKFLHKETRDFKTYKQIEERLTEPVKTENYPIFFDMYFSVNESAENICDYMEQFIALTYKRIRKCIGTEFGGKSINSIKIGLGYC